MSEQKTVYQWCEALQVDDSLVSGVLVLRRWDETHEVTQTEFEEAARELLDSPVGRHE